MTTYTKNALHILSNSGGDYDAFTAAISFSVPDGVTLLPYVANGFSSGEQFLIFSTVAGATLTSAAAGFGDFEPLIDYSFLSSITADIGSFTVFGFNLILSGGDEAVIASSVGGVEIPFISSLAEFQALESTFSSQSSTIVHDPGPGDSIDLANYFGITVTQDDVLRYTSAVEWVNVGLGNDNIDGGGGVDMLSFVSMTGGMTIDMDAGTAAGGGVAHSFQNFEGVTGSIFGDYIEGDAGDNRIRALGDYDWMVGSAGADSYDGGNGRDMISYVNNTSTNVIVDLGAGISVYGTGGDTYTSIERVTGTGFGDGFFGSDGEDDFRGLGGYDFFTGSGGGKDRYDGGSGLDTVSYLFKDYDNLATEGVVASLLLGRGSTGNAARDLYTSIENLEGTIYDDVLTGDNGRNQLMGSAGIDTLIGNGGVDRLTGGAGNDALNGGSGWDYALFDANQDEFSWSTSGGVTTIVHDTPTSSDFGTDTLTNIEVLSFADGDVIL